MNTKLAIFTAQIGTASETFIRWHVEDLLPGQTVAVVRNSTPAFGGFWHVGCPVFSLDRWGSRLSIRLGRRVGLSEKNMRDRAVRQFLEKHEISVVLGEYLDQFVDFVPILNKMGLRYVVQGHGVDLSASLRSPGVAKRYLAYMSADAVLTRCEFHRQRLIQIGLPSEKIHVNPGGVDVPSESFQRDPGARKHFLAVGRMVPKKGPIYLLEAFRLAAARDPEITLDYIGGGQLLAAAEQFVNASGLLQRVRLHGAASDSVKRRLFRECGVFVQHSVTDPDTGDEEGLPAAIQEAMAHNMVVLTTLHAGIPEAIEHGVTGLLVQQGDSRGMATEMCRIGREPAACAKLAEAAHLKAKQLYSWPSERKRLLAALACT